MKLHGIILGLLVPFAADAEGIDVAACRQKGELREACYPKSDEEWRAKCGAGTAECKETWKILSMARLQVKDDYARLCGHLATPPADCGKNCLDNAVAGTRTALDDVTKLESDLEKLRKATREARFDNLRKARELIQSPVEQALREPRCREDFGFALRVWEMIWSKGAWAASGGPPPGTTTTAPAPSPNPYGGSVASSSIDPDGTTTRPRPRDESPPPRAPDNPNPYGQPPPPNRVSKEAETTGYNQAAADKPVTESLFPQMRPAVAENLRASTGASTALRELGRKQTEVAQDKAKLERQLAELESRRNNLASAPGDPGAGPSRAFPTQASADMPGVPAAAFPSAGSGGGDLSFAPAAAQPDPARAKGTASRPDFLKPARAVASGGGGGFVPSADSENGRSHITHAADDLLPKNAANAAHATATAKDTQAGSRKKGSSLADALRRELDAKASAGKALEKADELLNKPGTAAEGAIASVIQDDGHSVSLAGGLHTGHDLTGLTPDKIDDRTDPEQAALMPADSPGLFERVHAAHRRFERAARTRTAGL